MTTRSPVLLGLAALAMSIYSMAVDGPGAPSEAQEVQSFGPAQESVALGPFACSLVVRAQDGGTVLESRIRSHEAISATYALKVRGPGVSIDQGGDLTLGKDESIVLGQVSVSGAASSLDASLTITFGGQQYTCPVQGS